MGSCDAAAACSVAVARLEQLNCSNVAEEFVERLRHVRVILLDVDGTTVDSDGHVAGDLPGAISEFLSLSSHDGVRRFVLFCTGRPRSCVNFASADLDPIIRQEWEILPPSSAMSALFPSADLCGVFSNGVAVHIPGKAETKYLGSMDRKTVTKILNWIADPRAGSRAFPWQAYFQLELFTYRFDFAGDAVLASRMSWADVQVVNLGSIREVRDAFVQSGWEGSVVRLCFDAQAHTQSTLYDHLQGLVGDALFVVKGGSCSVDVTPRGIHKGAGVSTLLRGLLDDIDTSLRPENFVMIGDSDNDIPAMQAVMDVGGLGVAMGNVAEGSNLARYVTFRTSCVTDIPSGVALVMQAVHQCSLSQASDSSHKKQGQRNEVLEQIRSQWSHMYDR